ncbi:ribosome-associated translation inhibitor RaiA [Alicyclobacillus mali]|uniref:Ribosome hibernation promoting factor n=1 Tax=Alicyclobacillus mali (ex Roth et al. 2021) TaxID=1123961 RepID=A0ABS0F439_9BACL|nr:ribosome-associated translation inhibitor RaiA [Alicyclobacillus mali (ex Roth et al. 2021)]MBF8378064.1 ribosome-associated translation inhibitor RaiA [Alicyclobacillus mali (ex Roth et al. 2021)]
MKVQVHGDNIAVTSALHQYVDKRISRLARFFEGENDKHVYVTMAVEGTDHRVEMTVYAYGVIFRVEEKSPDMYASIDLAADRLEEQIHRYKDKITVSRRQRSRTGRESDALYQQRVVLANTDALDVSDEFRVVRVKRFAMKPMTVQEAILQMNLLDHDFFVFTNADTDEMNVVYRRKNGDYGLIEPDGI